MITYTYYVSKTAVLQKTQSPSLHSLWFPLFMAEVWLSNERAEQKSAARALLCRDEECAILCPENKGFHE